MAQDILDIYTCRITNICAVSLQDGSADPENDTGQVQRMYCSDHRSSPQHHHRQRQDTGESSENLPLSTFLSLPLSTYLYLSSLSLPFYLHFPRWLSLSLSL